MASRKGTIIIGGIVLLVAAAVAFPFYDMRTNYTHSKARVVSTWCWFELDRVRGTTRVMDRTGELPCDVGLRRREEGAYSDYSFKRRIEYTYRSPVDRRVHTGLITDEFDSDPAVAAGGEINILVHTSEADDSLRDPAGY
jgi:hypothetical protein